MGVADTQERQTDNNLERLQICLQNCITALNETYFQWLIESAVCVELSIDSRNSANHNAYRILLRPSSFPEPRDPSRKIVKKKIDLL